MNYTPFLDKKVSQIDIATKYIFEGGNRNIIT